MKYRVRTNINFDKKLKKLDRSVQKLIIKYLKDNIDNSENPRTYGKGFVGDQVGLWRYRIGNYRIIADIKDSEIIVIASYLGQKKKYKNSTYIDNLWLKETVK